MKKFFALTVSVIMLATLLMPLCASAMITSYSGAMAVLPGNTRSASPDYSYAWLDNVILRHDPLAVTSTSMKPTPEDYSYSHTYDEFIKETNQYTTLLYLDENTAVSAYQELSSILFYLVTAVGLTDTQENMRQYLIDYGISLPANETIEDKMAIAVIYAAIKYDAVYTLYEKKVTIPQGVSLDGARVIVLAELTNIMLPSGIESLPALAILVMRNYVEGFEEIPISDDPTSEEIFYWVKVITASANDYEIALDSFEETTQQQKDYVDHAYYASVLESFYDVKISPEKLMTALQSGNNLAVAEVVLGSMLEASQFTAAEGTPCEELFNLACMNGYFDLENEFYSDVFSYTVEVPAECEKIWFTPFSLASQLDGGDEENVSVTLNGKAMSINSTVSANLDSAKSNEFIYLNVNYNDTQKGIAEAVSYKFNVVKNSSLNQSENISSENDLVAEVEKFVDTIIPNENAQAKETADGVFSSIDQIASSAADVVSQQDGVLTTYGVGENVQSGGESVSGYILTPSSSGSSDGTASTNRFDFNYLEDLIEGVYETDANGNVITTKSLTSENSNAEKLQQSILQRATEAVKEQPEIVAAPTTVLAISAFAGYLLTKKHRDAEYALYSEGEEDSEQTEEE